MKVIRGIDAALDALNRESFFEMQVNSPEMIRRVQSVFGNGVTVEGAVASILENVRTNGDRAVAEYTNMIDGIVNDSFLVSPAAIRKAIDGVPESIKDALNESAARVRDFHIATMPKSWMNEDKGFGEEIVPVNRAGLYIPGGNAAYPSTVIMTAIPAKIAGVKELIMATPPRFQGGPDPNVLAAADIAGVDRVFTIGGAQAIAAMAFGTESIPPVDIVCGPGNIFVTLAKKMLYGQVGIDGLEGPTETLIIADENANPAFCASDLLGQAEHDILATPVLITTDEKLVSNVQHQLAIQLAGMKKRDTISLSMDTRAVIVIVDNLTDAIEIANIYAPEHLCLMVREPRDLVPYIKNAGGIFLGSNSPEVMGDYVAGPSHVMPTGGTAKFNSSLGVSNFLKRIPVVDLNDATSKMLIQTASRIARVEGLEAHARSVELRGEL